MARHNRITSISTIQASLYELSQHVLTVQQKIRVLNQEVQELKENREQEIGTSNLDSIPPAAAHDDMEVAELDEIELEGMELENLQTEPVELENDTATQFYRVMMDAISGLYDCVSSIDISPEYVCSALVRPYNLPTCERMLERWENFKRHGVVDIKYCLSGILYWGHDDHDSPFSGERMIPP
ncbi:hypothetical protein NEUTE1DRAFT_102281 [Neurospora tetrasperma FGSC 2508]|uniref:Uncharacterized protein n=1 Tax=Neurospora tetrasperma (strain FGSC 2508 / ATCC MYA-4615 / P0657) TaxID=510951 RepID=F8MNX3_NEUT8|nr:uncharacterized protein NEUTE1DRAFT_102281 [Neurospora tetrasperma FGSC 2508]EGO57038.1 hypothetical protein NEUTE1DRAFT_102281 [Neurospora tetrasperma FGSC 2508]